VPFSSHLLPAFAFCAEARRMPQLAHPGEAGHEECSHFERPPHKKGDTKHSAAKPQDLWPESVILYRPLSHNNLTKTRTRSHNALPRSA